ncbi:hypothetical protein GQ457_01G026900 [Hibiscus cannabinus]
MASSFDRWEKDPFFSVAEEVQQSADRTWIHALKDVSCTWNLKEIGRDLRTAISTTKWQLEEFEMAVQLSSQCEEARERHSDFIAAIKDQILTIEKYLLESACSEVRSSMHLDEGERNELALFLSAPPQPGDFLKKPVQPIEFSSSEANSEMSVGHRRAASAADIGAWKMAILDDVSQQNSSNGRPPIPRKAPSSGSLSSRESAATGKWSKNSFRNSKAMSHYSAVLNELKFLRSSISVYLFLLQGNDECFEKKSGGVDCDENQLNGWYGSIQTQLRRSQHQMKSSSLINIAVWALMLICLIGELLSLTSSSFFGVFYSFIPSAVLFSSKAYILFLIHAVLIVLHNI